MRLATRILERVSVRTGTPLDADWPLVAAILKEAQCFEVTKEVGMLACATTDTSPSKAIERTLQRLALPAPVTWFEWLGPTSRMGRNPDKPPEAGQDVPDRCGALVKTIDAERRRGIASFYWSAPGRQPEGCLFANSFDLNPTPGFVPDVARAALRGHGLSIEDTYRKDYEQAPHPSQPFADFFRTQMHFGTLESPFLRTMWAALERMSKRDEAAAQRIAFASLNDLKGEMVFVLGVLMLMCTEGMVEIDGPEDVSRLNAARRKRGKPDLLPFHTLRTSGQNVIRLSNRGGPVETAAGFYAA